MEFIVDASVAVKWFSSEIRTKQASLLRAQRGQLIAPDLLAVEVANALLMKHRRGELSASDCEDAITALPELVELKGSTPALLLAFELARAYPVTIYDALYVALSRISGSRLVTADRRLYDAALRIDEDAVTWIEDVAEPLATDGD